MLVDTLSAVSVTAEHHPAFEEYCECIFEMREDNAEVIQARLAERLDVSDRKSTRLNSSHVSESRMPSSA